MTSLLDLPVSHFVNNRKCVCKHILNKQICKNENREFCYYYKLQKWNLSIWKYVWKKWFYVRIKLSKRSSFSWRKKKRLLQRPYYFPQKYSCLTNCAPNNIHTNQLSHFSQIDSINLIVFRSQSIVLLPSEAYMRSKRPDILLQCVIKVVNWNDCPCKKTQHNRNKITFDWETRIEVQPFVYKVANWIKKTFVSLRL